MSNGQNTQLLDQLNTQRAEQQSTAIATRRDIFTDLASERTRQEFAVALPKVAGLTVERFTRVAITTLRTTPRLLECSRISLLSALVTTAQLGLEPGGPLGHAYLVPFRSRERGWEVQLIVGYQGYVALAYRSGVVDNISAELVREGDEYDLTLGAHRDLIHKPNKYDRSGKVQVAYAVCTLKDGGAPIFETLTTAQVEERRKRSRAKDSGPWVTDWEQMARKSAVRALKPFLPMAVQGALAEADAHDDVALTIDSVLTDDGTDATGGPIVIDAGPAPTAAADGAAPDFDEPAAPPRAPRTRTRRGQTPATPAGDGGQQAPGGAAGAPPSPPAPPALTDLPSRPEAASPPHPPPSATSSPESSHGAASGDAAETPATANAPAPGAAPGASAPPASTPDLTSAARAGDVAISHLCAAVSRGRTYAVGELTEAESAFALDTVGAIVLGDVMLAQGIDKAWRVQKRDIAFIRDDVVRLQGKLVAKDRSRASAIIQNEHWPWRWTQGSVKAWIDHLEREHLLSLLAAYREALAPTAQLGLPT